MSEVKRWDFVGGDGPSAYPQQEPDGRMVAYVDYAALREELANRTDRVAELAQQRNDLQQRLADAERRNGDYEFNLMYLRSQIDNSVLVAYIEAALNKPEEAKSSDYLESCEAAHRALSFENQRIQPARFHCLACGECHEGSGNLPCPKMSPMSGGKP